MQSEMVGRFLDLSRNLFGAGGVVRVDEQCDVRRVRHQFMRQLQPLRGERCVQLTDAGDIAAGPANVVDKADLDWVACRSEHHRNRVGRLLRSEIGGRVGDDHRDLTFHEIGGERRQATIITVGPSVLDCDVFAFNKSALFQPGVK